MQNPYAPPTGKSSRRSTMGAGVLSERAGVWLSVAGAAHFLMGSLPFSFENPVNWSPLLLLVLGVGVYFQFLAAENIARLIGTLALIGCAMITILSVAGLAPNEPLSYGHFNIASPRWWHVAICVAAIAMTFGPPWYMLQIKLRPAEPESNGTQNTPPA